MTIHTLIEALRELLIIIPAVLLTITVHEYFQLLAAIKFGDTTPSDNGYFRFNPLLFIDIIGFLMFVLFRYGWSKNIPYDERNFKYSKLQSFYVILTGLAANLLTAFVFILLIVLYKPRPDGYIYNLFMASTQLNLNYFVLSLVPLYPMAAGRVINIFYPKFYKTEFIGTLLLVLMIVFNFTATFDKIIFDFIKIFI